jgi:hypothetical protein
MISSGVSVSRDLGVQLSHQRFGGRLAWGCLVSQFLRFLQAGYRPCCLSEFRGLEIAAPKEDGHLASLALDAARVGRDPESERFAPDSCTRSSIDPR